VGEPSVRQWSVADRIRVQQGLRNIFAHPWNRSRKGTVEGPMTKKDKIAFIKSSKRKTHVYHDLNRYSDQQLNDIIREIVQGLIRESEIIANAYINGYR
jgi:predicted nucleic acid-binding OB-fold protein